MSSPTDKRALTEAWCESESTHHDSAHLVEYAANPYSRLSNDLAAMETEQVRTE